MKPVRLSFVLASYNGAAFIGAQLVSILADLGSDDEIVVSDDGSTDDTRAIVAAVADSRVVLLPEAGRLGYQANFERAIAAARGTYVLFSDQDDICLPVRIPASLAALAAADCVCGDAVVVDQELKPLQGSYFAARRARFGPLQLFLRPAVIGATLGCRREFLLASLPFPHGVPHDLWLSVVAARRGQLAVVRQPFILYRRHPGVASATAERSRRPYLRRVDERLRLLRALVWPPRDRRPTA